MVAVTPLITVVTTPFELEMVDPVMIDDVEVTPLIEDVNVLSDVVSELLSMNCAVVVAVTPLITDVSVKEFVDVETVIVLDVDDAMRLLRSVDVATPLMVVVRVVPDVERAFEEITDEVAVTPLMTVVNVLPERD